jgi:hypothetical protein
VSKKSSDWYIPPDIAMFLIIPSIVILSGMLLPAITNIRRAEVIDLFYGALGLGCLGSILLFFARIPLYRQHRFWTFGPHELPGFQRKLYWLAYVVVVAALLLLGIVWLRVK